MRTCLPRAARKTLPPATQRSSPDAGMGWSRCLNRKKYNEASRFTGKITAVQLDNIMSQETQFVLRRLYYQISFSHLGL